MSRIQTVTVVDDLDGRELDPEEAHTVAWTWLGVDYELDVSPANLDKIEEGKVTVAKLLTASTRVGGRRQVRGSKRNGTSKASSSQNAQIREWAIANGFEVSPRGRIAREVVEAYEAAN